MPPITGDGLAPTGSPGGPDQLAPSWSSVVDTLAPAAEAGTLSGVELDDLADAAHLVGRNDLHHRARERAIDTHLEEGNPRRAARSAFWLGTVLAQGGEPARANGWLSRAARLLADQPEAVEHGYLLLPRGLMALGSHDADTALECFGRAVALAEVFTALLPLFATRAEEAGLQLRIRATPLWVQTDPQLLQRLLANLVENAIKYTAQGGVLVLARARDRGRRRERACDFRRQHRRQGMARPPDARRRARASALWVGAEQGIRDR